MYLLSLSSSRHCLPCVRTSQVAVACICFFIILPLTLVGGCPLHVAPVTFLLGVATSPLGPSFVGQVPNSAALVGQTVFGQLYQLDQAGALRTSPGVAFHIGN